MLAKPDLLKLARNKSKDATALLKARRYAAAVYLAGYAVELILKYRICSFLQFRQGFPETAAEFNSYLSSSSGTIINTVITHIQQIKIHDLTRLLFYSGEQATIINQYDNDWSIVSGWSHLDRYSITIVRKLDAKQFLDAVHIIVNALI